MLARNLPSFTARGVQVVPMLAQRAAPVRRYVEETGLPFNVLIDTTRDVVRAYGVWHRLGMDAWNIARPAVFLIDTDGRILYSAIGDDQREFPTEEELLAVIRSATSAS